MGGRYQQAEQALARNAAGTGAAAGAAQQIECYDISNTQGTATVASMVVFEQGTPSKKLYRRFNIQTVEGPDDFASMEEVLTRRFKRWQAAQEDRNATRAKSWTRPSHLCPTC